MQVYGNVKYKVSKCVRVENTSTENSSTATQGWKTQVWKIKVRVSRVGKCKYGKIEYGITINCRKRAAEEPTESLRRIFDRQTQSSESAAATVVFNDIESSMYKRRRMQNRYFRQQCCGVSLRILGTRYETCNGQPRLIRFLTLDFIIC